MPPGQKGMSKKGGGKDSSRPPRSRNSTPSVGGPSAFVAQEETALLQTRLVTLPGYKYEDMVDVNSSAIPDSKTLESLMEKLRQIAESVEAKNQIVDKGMRKLATFRRDCAEEAAQELREAELKEQKKKENEDRMKKAGKKRDAGGQIKAKEERPLTHGAHGVAAQDGTSIDAAEASANPRHERRDSGSSSLSPPANAASPDTAAQATVASDDDDDDSEDERQPPPAPNATAVQYFSDDPFTFPDPVNYELGHVEEGMTDEQIRQTCGVAHFPAKDLSELAAGDAPDKDFSNAKPASQVQYATFQNFIEPYFRPMEDADLGWLRERGDRVTPFIIPPRGKKHWREVWAEEDAIAAGGSGSASASKETERVEASEIGTLPPEAAEKDSVEVGPMATRLLQLMRPEYRVAAADLGNDNGTNGDQAMGGMGGDDNDDLNNILDVDNGSNGLGGGVNNSFDDPMSMVSSLPPATQMPGSNTEAYKKNTPVSLTGAQINERIRQQMIYLGFIPADDPKPEYDGHFDDEIAGRLRLLQGQLRERVIINGARKARMLDIAKDYMAKQEFDTVAEDLDNQLNSNFAKRTRTMGKKGKAKRNTATGSTAAPAGQAKAAIGDQTRLLMERRTKWKNTVGNVFEEHEKMPRYDVSLWDDEAMRPYIEAEKERWDQDEAEAANLQDELA